MKSRARSIFGNAQVYDRAARLLNTAGASDLAMLLPSMVNAALSLELYFKSLYALDRGAEFKVKGKHSHDFATLFEELHEPTKQHLLAKFNAAISARATDDIRMIESTLKMVVPRDLKTNLIQWASLFTDLRYAYYFIEKNKGMQKTMMFFPEIRDSVYNTIIEHESTWKS
jgi:hypothetical protein